MRILALETSTQTASIALFDGEELISEQRLDQQQRTAQSLVPAIDNQLRDAAWRPSHIQLIAVSRGPGSFTGLRIGITTAKTLAYALKAEVLGLSTLDLVAAQATSNSDQVWAVVDAHRQQLFVRQYVPDLGGQLQGLDQPAIVSVEPWLEELEVGVTLIGPGLAKICQHLPPQVVVEDESRWTPRASTVAELGFREYQSGRRDDLWQLEPFYLRQSAAEEARGTIRE